MRGSERSRLRDLLLHKAREAREDAIEANGRIAKERVDELGRLARLAEICEAAESRRAEAWPIAAAFLVTLAIVSGLLFARVSETEIELDLVVSGLRFSVPRQQVLTELVNLEAVGASGLQTVALPDPQAKQQEPAALRTNGSAVRLSLAPDGIFGGALTLATASVSPGTAVEVAETDVPGQYRLVLEGEDLTLRVDLVGDVVVGRPGAVAERHRFATPESVRMAAAGTEVVLDLTMSDSSSGLFAPDLAAADLAFSRIDEVSDPQRTIVRRLSTILSGTLYYEALNGAARSFRGGEALHFEQARGEIRSISFQDDHIAVAFHGRVRGMTTGSTDNSRSLMPTYLEWLRARHGLSLLWGTTLYVLGLIVGVVHWWRRLT